MKLSAEKRFIELNGSFRVAFGTLNGLDIVAVEIRDGEHVGRGECCPMGIYGQHADQTLAEIKAVIPLLEADNYSRESLQNLLPAKAARNAIDCALWDLEAKRSGKSVWELANVSPKARLDSDVSIGIGTPAETTAKAIDLRGASCIKLKLGGEDDLGCVRAVRDTLPDTPLFVDVNCGWNLQQLNELSPQLHQLGVFMIEQPLAIGRDEELDAYTGPVALCADESCHDRSDLPLLKERYQYINIKLDKTGGLTEALSLANAAKGSGFRLMVGCMLGTGVAMA
ncbi:dipeptide epimerase, partial [Luminiphilus syltensis]